MKYSKFDKRHNVKTPRLSSQLLAYETGVHIGDGSLQIIDKKTHSIRYFGHSDDDWLYFSRVLPEIIKRLYNKDVKPLKRKNTKKCVLSICSKKIALFKKSIGLPVGNKIILKDLPDFIKKDKELLINCLRGIADTDFTLTFNKNHKSLHPYPEISCVMSNKDLIISLHKHLKEIGLHFNLKTDVKRIRKGNINIEHKITMYGKDNFLEWMDKIGFLNPKHITKFLVWRKFGFCPPHLTTKQRILILRGELNPHSFYNSFQPKAKTP